MLMMSFSKKLLASAVLLPPLLSATADEETSLIRSMMARIDALEKLTQEQQTLIERLQNTHEVHKFSNEEMNRKLQQIGTVKATPEPTSGPTPTPKPTVSPAPTVDPDLACLPKFDSAIGQCVYSEPVFFEETVVVHGPAFFVDSVLMGEEGNEESTVFFGSEVTFDNDVTFDDDVNLDAGHVSIHADVTVSGDHTSVVFEDGVDVTLKDHSSLVVESPALFTDDVRIASRRSSGSSKGGGNGPDLLVGGDLTVKGHSRLDGGARVDGHLSVDGDATVENDLVVKDDVSVRGGLDVVGATTVTDITASGTVLP